MWETRLETLIDEPDYKWLMIDASHGNVHPHAAGAKGGNQEMSRTTGGSTPRDFWPWMRRVCRSESLSRKGPGRWHASGPADGGDRGRASDCR